MTTDGTLGTDPLTGPLPTAALPPDQAPIEDPVITDYFGFDTTDRWMLPDGIQFMVVRKMNEGGKARFQKTTNRDVVLERQSGNARMKLDPGEERHELIRNSVIDWSLYWRDTKTDNMVPAPFNRTNLDKWLTGADPQLVEDLEKFIRKMNPWLLGEMSVADIDREIANLQEMRAVAVEREAGEGASSSR